MKRAAAWFRTLGPRERRALLLGAAILASAWMGLRGLPAAARALAATGERAEQAEMALARARAAIIFEPVARESLAVRARRLVALAPRLFAGATAAEAGAEVGAWVSGQAALTGVRVVRQAYSGDSLIAPFRVITLRIEAEGDIAGIARWLASLDGGVKLMAVEQLNVTALEPGAAASQSERLRVELVLVAWNALPPSAE